jgi:hypothetical protein
MENGEIYMWIEFKARFISRIILRENSLEKFRNEIK